MVNDAVLEYIYEKVQKLKSALLLIMRIKKFS